MKDLTEIRKEINKIDDEMAKLFVKRMEQIEQVAEYKKQHGIAVLDEKREEQVIRQNSARVENATIREYYTNFIRENMAISRAYQSRIIEGMKVAYSGTEGAFAYLASKKLFDTAKLIPYKSFDLAYKSVEDGECDACVLPIENSYNGEVGQVTELLFSGSLYVNTAVELEVTQDLLGVKGAKLEDITDVYSHNQAIGQCDLFIKEHNITAHEYVNTALAAKYVAELNQKNIGAIASREAGKLFGLNVLEKNVNLSKTNTTRFLVCTRKNNLEVKDEKSIRSILIFTVRNETGALASAIDIISKHNYNMVTLRSRPMKQHLWQYYFYVEFEGNINSEDGKNMLKDLTVSCDKIKVVGTYLPN